jgi:hypothetical protein
MVGEARRKASAEVRGRADSGKRQAADALGSVARSLRASSVELRNEQRAQIGDYVDMAADRVDRAASYLRETELADMVGGVERFARRQPAVFLGAAFAIGLIGARFLKSSRREDLHERIVQPGGLDTNRRLPVPERDVTASRLAPFGDRPEPFGAEDASTRRAGMELGPESRPTDSRIDATNPYGGAGGAGGSSGAPDL